MQAEAARLLGTHLGVNRSSYAEIDGDWAVLRGRYSDGVGPLPDRLPLAAFGAVVEESRRGRMVSSDDVRSDARVSEAALAAFDAIPMRAFVNVVLIKDGRWVACFGVDSATPRAWTVEDRALIREVAERTWAAAEQARAEAALRESEAMHRRLFETLEEGFAVGELVRDARGQPIDWRLLFVNAGLERLSGLRPGTSSAGSVARSFRRTIATGWRSSRTSWRRSARGASSAAAWRTAASGRRRRPVRRRSLCVALPRRHTAEAGGGGPAGQRDAAGVPVPARRRAAAARRRGRHPVRSGVHAGRAAAGRLLHYVDLDEANDRSDSHLSTFAPARATRRQPTVRALRLDRAHLPARRVPRHRRLRTSPVFPTRRVPRCPPYPWALHVRAAGEGWPARGGIVGERPGATYVDV